MGLLEVTVVYYFVGVVCYVSLPPYPLKQRVMACDGIECAGREGDNCYFSGVTALKGSGVR